MNPRPAYDQRGGRGGRGRGGQGGGGRGGQGGRGGGTAAAWRRRSRRPRRLRPRRRGGAGRGDVEQHGRDGSFRSSVRIIGLEALEDAVRGNEKAQEGENAGNGGSNSEDLASKN